MLCINTPAESTAKWCLINSFSFWSPDKITNKKKKEWSKNATQTKLGVQYLTSKVFVFFVFLLAFSAGFSKCLQQSSTELQPGFDGEKVDSQVDATAAREPFTLPHTRTHARQHTLTLSEMGKGKVVALPTWENDCQACTQHSILVNFTK